MNFIKNVLAMIGLVTVIGACIKCGQEMKEEETKAEKKEPAAE